TLLPYTITLTNLGGAASASGQLLVMPPDGTSSTIPVPPIAPSASTTINVTWTVPVVPPNAPLAQFDGRPLTLNASLNWSDAAANGYGPISAQSQTTERIPVLSIAAGALPASVLPGDSITAAFTIFNRGSASSQTGQLTVTLPDGTTT